MRKADVLSLRAELRAAWHRALEALGAEPRPMTPERRAYLVARVEASGEALRAFESTKSARLTP